MKRRSTGLPYCIITSKHKKYAAHLQALLLSTEMFSKIKLLPGCDESFKHIKRLPAKEKIVVIADICVSELFHVFDFAEQVSLTDRNVITLAVDDSIKPQYMIRVQESTFVKRYIVYPKDETEWLDFVERIEDAVLDGIE